MEQLTSAANSRASIKHTAEFFEAVVSQNLRSTDFHRLYLRGWVFDSSYLGSAPFEQCNFEGSYLRNVNFRKTTEFIGCDFRGARFTANVGALLIDERRVPFPEGTEDQARAMQLNDLHNFARRFSSGDNQGYADVMQQEFSIFVEQYNQLETTLAKFATAELETARDRWESIIQEQHIDANAAPSDITNRVITGNFGGSKFLECDLAGSQWINTFWRNKTLACSFCGAHFHANDFADIKFTACLFEGATLDGALITDILGQQG